MYSTFDQKIKVEVKTNDTDTPVKTNDTDPRKWSV